MRMHYVIAAAVLLAPSISLASSADGLTVTKAAAPAGHMMFAQLKKAPPGLPTMPKLPGKLADKVPPGKLPPPPPLPVKKKP